MRLAFLTIATALAVSIGATSIYFGRSALAADAPAATAPAAAPNMPLLLDEDFSKGADRWAPAWPEGWKIIDIDGRKAYSEFQNPELKPPKRSPWEIALLKEIEVGDFVLEVKMRETAHEYPHRDSVVVFGYQGPTNFYYVHFAPVTGDQNADQMFIVNDADRKKITDNDHLSTGAVWGEPTQWHRLKVVRKVADGLIEAYFDDMEKPLMVAHDKTFTWGRIGIGTFDDTADFAEVKLWGNKANPPATEAGDTSQPPYPGVKKKEPAPPK